MCLGSLCRCQSIDRASSIKWGICLGHLRESVSCQNTADFSCKEAIFSKPSPQYLSQWMSDSLQRSVTTGTKKWLSAQLTHHTGGSLWLTLHIMQDISGTLNPICINMFLVQNRGLTIRPCHHKTTTPNLFTIRPQLLTQKQMRNFPLQAF